MLDAVRRYVEAGREALTPERAEELARTLVREGQARRDQVSHLARGAAPALLMGIEDPSSNAHAPNESLHEGDFKKLMASLVRLFDGLGKLTPDRVK